jgi:hypothetical protein
VAVAALKQQALTLLVVAAVQVVIRLRQGLRCLAQQLSLSGQAEQAKQQHLVQELKVPTLFFPALLLKEEAAAAAKMLQALQAVPAEVQVLADSAGLAVPEHLDREIMAVILQTSPLWVLAAAAVLVKLVKTELALTERMAAMV